MKLKSNIGKVLFFTFHFSLFTSALLTSCSDIPEDERLIYVEPTQAARNVLIEDFTGQRCVNCPKASVAIHEIQQVYGENVVAVAIHCGPFGGLSAKNQGLMNSTGKEYWNAWFDSSQGQPVAKINRGAATNSIQNWAADVAACLQQSTDVSIDAETAYNAETNELAINVKTTAKAGYTGKIQVWLTEDSIIARQDYEIEENNSKKTVHDNEYVHQHVFRAAVNGTWGEDITYGLDELQLNWTTTLDTEWKAENVNVIVFVYDDKGVEQVIQVPAIK